MQLIPRGLLTVLHFDSLSGTLLAESYQVITSGCKIMSPSLELLRPNALGRKTTLQLPLPNAPFLLGRLRIRALVQSQWKLLWLMLAFLLGLVSSGS